MTTMADPILSSVPALWEELTGKVARGRRFADLFATAQAGGLLLTAHLVGPDGVETLEAMLPSGTVSYPALTPRLGAAFWYEREIHDLFGVVPQGHHRLDPLILPASGGAARAGSPGQPPATAPDPSVLPRQVAGPGLFTIPHGPVRSGVMESIEYLVETPGEDVLHLNMRLFYKHRGIEERFEGMTIADGVLLAERTEGIATVAHALAYCQAAERIAGVAVPWAASLVRVVHAELERLACHLDVIVRLADAAGLSVATARFGWHKEQVLRLVSRLCGSRFGRGVIVPGGVLGYPRISPADLLSGLGELDRRVTADIGHVMGTASFLDRLRRTGPLRRERAAEHGALGPVGRASGLTEDARQERSYAAYGSLSLRIASRVDGDAMARLEVRVEEIAQSFHLLRQAADELAEVAGEPVRASCAPGDGREVGWAEAPQGEVLYDVRIAGGRIERCRVRSASFHNLVLMHEVFAGDVLTDFPFIEASFGLSIAGVAR
ncbi:MAG: NADH-quinone oxidoreductase subunit C [Streptosporangiaceae bacterium]